jgi:hypothetical protein
MVIFSKSLLKMRGLLNENLEFRIQNLEFGTLINEITAIGL